MPDKTISFVLNDETKVNSYGFKIPNKGIDLKRFKNNSVILDDHSNSTKYVIGKWSNIRVEDGQLKADAEFDLEDPASAIIAGKVERGFLKGCSMGISFNRDDMKQLPDNTYELSRCELYEASIVAIPSNANALKLYAESGELLSDEQIKLSLSQITETINNKNQNEMNKIILSFAALQVLGLSSTEDDKALSLSIEKLTNDFAKVKADLAASEAEKTRLQGELDKGVNLSATTLIDQAIEDGKLTAAVRDQWIKMATADLSAITQTVATLQTTTKLSGEINNPSTPGEVKTQDDFQKLSVEEQKAFKANKPEDYKKLFA